MEELEVLKSLFVIKKTSEMGVNDYKIADLGTDYPKLVAYSIVLPVENLQAVRDYIAQSSIPNADHMLKIFDSRPAPVARILFQRVDVSNIPTVYLNDYANEEALIAEYEGASVAVEEEHSEPVEVSLEPEPYEEPEPFRLEPQEEEPMREFPSVEHKDYDDTDARMKTNENTVVNDIKLDEALDGIAQLQDQLSYALVVIDALASKGGVNVRGDSKLLNHSEILKVVASLKKYNDTDFRKLIEKTLLEAESRSDLRTITDFLHMLFSIQKRKEN